MHEAKRGSEAVGRIWLWVIGAKIATTRIGVVGQSPRTSVASGGIQPASRICPGRLEQNRGEEAVPVIPRESLPCSTSGGIRATEGRPRG